MVLEKLRFYVHAIWVILLLFSCVDPVEPQFEYKEGLVFI